MSTQTATLTFALPEDADSDTIKVSASSIQAGPYVLVATLAYQYGLTTAQLSLDDTLWYQIQFANSKNNLNGPVSDPVYGGNYSEAAPFLAVSTTTDGANYATTTDVYDFAGLNPVDVSQDFVSVGLRRARALIDFRMSEMNLERFQLFTAQTARRKYNATMRLIKEAEICFALETIYYRLSDTLIIRNMRDATSSGATAGTVSIGDVSAQGDSLAERSENIIYLSTLAAKYAAMGNQLLSTLQQNTVVLTGYEFIHRFPRFLYPFEVVH